MIIVLNNKSNLDKEEFLDYNTKLELIETKHELILCPSTINIPYATHEDYKLGAQNISKFNEGAHTGEVSASQLVSNDVEYAIIGHSERRELENETDEDINMKIKMALKNNITPILCIGETKDERDNNEYQEVIAKELSFAIRELLEEEIEKMIIAYEPIWSIGTGVIPTIDQINEVFGLIKEYLPNNKVLYGGSVNEDNIEELNSCEHIDGYLLGGLSLELDKLQVFLEKIKG